VAPDDKPRGEILSLPHARPLPSIGPRCHELRISDRGLAWRIVYRIDDDAIVVVAVFKKQSRRTPTVVVAACRRRLLAYDSLGAP
jgi:phage-related protein